MIDVVLLDASGVLFDDLRPVWQANAMVIRHLTGRPFGLEEFRERFKLPYWEFYEEIGIPLAQARTGANESFKRFYTSMRDQVRLFPEVKETLQLLKEKSRRLGVVSQTPCVFLREQLERQGIESFFEVIIGLEDSGELKPSPKPIMEALLHMGHPEPLTTAYVGGMEEDILAGRRAGARTVAVLRRRSYQPWFKVKRQRPDRVVYKLDELPQALSSM